MSYSLQNWNKLVTETLHSSNAKHFSHTPESIQNIIQQSKDEYEKVRNHLIEDILERVRIKDKKQYIKVTQVMLVDLLDKLYSYKQLKELSQKVLNLYDEIGNHLENTLGFIRLIFSNYFDYNEKAPWSYGDVSISEFRKKITLISKGNRSSSGHYGELIEILIGNFNKFCSQNKSSVTYNELMYQKDLMNHLLKAETLSSENLIKEVLFYLNYNDEQYLGYLYKKLTDIITPITNKKEKIAALLYEQKIFNQLHTRPGCQLTKEMPSLKEQLNYWIEEEVKFLYRNDAIKGSVDPALIKKDIYVHVPFRGTEIYLLHKAFIDSGGTSGETYKSLFEKTGSHLTNNNQRGFSTESLQKNSDKINYEVKDNVKRFLQKMIRNIDSY